MKKIRTRKEAASDLLQAAQEMLAVHQGQILATRVTKLEPVNALQARQNLHLTREQFANLIGVSERTLESWEQGLRQPSGAARALLRVVQTEPQAVLRSLQ
jgi:putative transcriptional regulator